MDLYASLQTKIKELPRKIYINPEFKLKQSEDKIRAADNTESEFLLIHNETHQVILISEREAFIWTELKTNPNVHVAVYQYYRKYHDIGFELFQEILVVWDEQSIIVQKDLYDKITERIQRKPWQQILDKINTLATLELTSDRFANSINIIFDRYLFYLKHRIVLIAVLLFSLIMNSLFLFDIIFNPEIIKGSKNNSKLYFFIILGLSLSSLWAHEIGHGFAHRLYGLTVKRAGIKFFWTIPSFFVDTSEAWLKDEHERIKISAAGVLTNFFIAAVSFSMYLIFNDFEIPRFFFLQLTIINIMYFFVNLNPFIELDGYYIALDILDTPNMKKKALGELSTFFKSGKVTNRKLFIYSIFSIISMIVMSSFGLYVIYHNISFLLG